MICKNELTLEGFVELAPQLVGQTSSVCLLPVRVDDTIRQGPRKGETRTDVVPVRVFGELAQSVAAWKALVPGVPVRVIGQIRQNVFEGRDGQQRSTIEVHARNVAILTAPPSSAAGPRQPMEALDPLEERPS